MLPALLENNSEERARMNSSTVDKKNIVHQSLLEWVTARQGLTNLEHIVKHCENSLKQVYNKFSFLNNELSVIHINIWYVSV